MGRVGPQGATRTCPCGGKAAQATGRRLRPENLSVKPAAAACCPLSWTPAFLLLRVPPHRAALGESPTDADLIS